MLNAAQLARGLAVDGKTIAKYLDLMVDLLLELPGGRLWAVEVKRGSAPKLEKGSQAALADLKPDQAFLVYSGQDRYPKGTGVEAIGLPELTALG